MYFQRFYKAVIKFFYHLSAEPHPTSRNRIAKAQIPTSWKNFHSQTPARWTNTNHRNSSSNTEHTSTSFCSQPHQLNVQSPQGSWPQTAQSLSSPRYNDKDCTANILNALRVNMSDIFRRVRQVLKKAGWEICEIYQWLPQKLFMK